MHRTLRLALAALVFAGACRKEPQQPGVSTESTKALDPAPADGAAREPAPITPEPPTMGAPDVRLADLSEGAQDLNAHAAILARMFEALGNGRYEQAFDEFEEAAVWSELGTPTELTGRSAVRGFFDASDDAFDAPAFQPSRIVDLGEHTFVEYVWRGKHARALAGASATDREVVVPGAMLVHFTGDRIDRVWDAFDLGALYAAIGAVPSPSAEARTTPDWPEAARVIVAGTANQALAERYRAAMERLSGESFEAVLREVASENLVATDRTSGRRVSGLAENVAAMKSALASMGDYSVRVDRVWGAGDWVVALQTYRYQYRGGVPGVVAADQRVEVPVLAIAHFDGDRMDSYRDYGNSLGLMSQLGMSLPGGAAPRPDAQATSAGRLDDAGASTTSTDGGR